jgi:hypothetical protein
MIVSSAFHFFAAGQACRGGSFFGLPTWYKYLSCGNGTVPQITNINDVWLILAAIIEALVRIAGLIAVFYVIYGGIQLMISRGEPDKFAQARSTIINAVVGVAIAILAASAVNFVAKRIR